jgi:hypothetical protein
METLMMSKRLEICNLKADDPRLKVVDNTTLSTVL